VQNDLGSQARGESPQCAVVHGTKNSGGQTQSFAKRPHARLSCGRPRNERAATVGDRRLRRCLFAILPAARCRPGDPVTANGNRVVEHTGIRQTNPTFLYQHGLGICDQPSLHAGSISHPLREHLLQGAESLGNCANKANRVAIKDRDLSSNGRIQQSRGRNGAIARVSHYNGKTQCQPSSQKAMSLSPEN